MRYLSIFLLILSQHGLSGQEIDYHLADSLIQSSDIDSAISVLSQEEGDSPELLYRKEFLQIIKNAESLEEGKKEIEKHLLKYKDQEVSGFTRITYRSFFINQLIPYDSENEFNLSFLERTLSEYYNREVQDSFLLMHLLHNQGNLLYELDRNEEAVESLESSLEIAQRIDTRDSSFLAIVYFNLAYPVENINQDNRAYELVEKSAAELAKLKNPNIDYYQSVCLSLFQTSLTFGYYEKADNYLSKAEQIYAENKKFLTGGKPGKIDQKECTLLYNRMLLYNSTKDLNGLLDVFKKADLRFSGNEDPFIKLRLAAIYNYMGEAYVIDSPEKSFKFYKKASAIYDKEENYRYSLMFDFNLGKAYLNSGRLEDALDVAETIIEKGESIDDYRLPFFYYLLAKAKLKKGLLDESLTALDKVANSKNKSEIPVNLLTQEGILSFIPSENLYDGYLMIGAARDIAEAIPPSKESNMAMNSLYRLGMASLLANFKKDKFTDKSKEEYEKMMHGIYSTSLYLGEETVAYSDLIKLSENASSRNLWEKIKFKNQLLDVVDPKLLEKEQELRAEITELKIALFEADSLKIKAQLFDKELALESIELEKRQKYNSFYQYEDFEFDFVAFQNALGPNQKVLKYEILDSILYCYEIGQNSIELKSLDSIKRIKKEIEEFVQMVRTPSSDLAKLNQLADKLGEILIPNLRESEILIISNGILNYLPFDILRKEGSYMIDKFVIRHATSMALLSQSKADGGIRNSLIVSPSYEKYTLSSQQLAVRGAEYNLEGALAEADAIAEIIPATKFSRSNASKKEFLKQAANFDLLHLSMHSFINDDDPELSSLVFFDGDEENELFISELYGMNLDAKLAVLSACNTGVGKEITGEGMVSVNHAFTYAGVPSVVSSLWSAPDKATQEIMTTFYSHLSNGLPKAEALRLAKQDYRKGQSVDALNHPFFWGGFVLHGSNDALDFKNKNLDFKIGAAVLGVSTLIILGLFLRRRFAS